MNLSSMLSGLSGNSGGGANSPPNPTSATPTNKPSAGGGGSAPQITIPADKYNDAPKVDAAAEKVGTDAERIRAKQTNELIRLNTGMLNVLRNIHNFNVETLRSQNMATKLASIEAGRGGDATSTSSRSSMGGGMGSALLLGAAAGALFPAILGLGKAFEGLANFIGSMFGTDGLRSGTEAAGGLATGAGAAKGFLNKFMGRGGAEPEAAPKTRVREGFTQEGNRYRNNQTGRIASAADAVEEVRPGALQRVTTSVVKGVRGATLSFLKKVLAFAAKYGRLLSVLVYLIEPVVALIESGGEITQEVKKSLAKAFVGLLLNEAAAAAIGALLGSIVPGPGTVIGAVLGVGGSFALGMLAGSAIEVIANELASAFVGEKSWGEAADTIGTTIKDGASKAVSTAAAAVSTTGESYASSTYNKVSETLGGGMLGKAAGGLASITAFGVGAGVGAATTATDYLFGTKTNDAVQLSTPPATGGGTSAKDLLQPKGMGGGRVSPIGGMEEIKNMIKAHEGVRAQPYKDSEGLWTIGYGHLIGNGSSPGEYAGRTLSKEEIDALFEEDFAKHYKIAEGTPGWSKANMTGKAAMIDLAFNMGQWWKKFPNTSKALADGNAQGAADGLRNSLWYKQVGPGRGNQIISMIAAGFNGGSSVTGDSNVAVASAQQTPGASAESGVTPNNSAGNGNVVASQQAPNVDTAAQISPPTAGRGGGRRGRMSSMANATSGNPGQTMAMPGNQSIPAPTASKGGLDLLWYFGAAA